MAVEIVLPISTEMEFLVSTPAYIFDTSESLTGSIGTLFHSSKVRFGEIQIRYLAKNPGQSQFVELHSETSKWTHDFSFEFELDRFRQNGRLLDGTVIRIEAVLYDAFLGESRQAFAETKVVPSAVKINFFGPKNPIFQPGTRYTGYVVVSHGNNIKVDSALIQSGKLGITATAVFDRGHQEHLPGVLIPPIEESSISSENVGADRFWREGVLKFSFDIPRNADELRVSATFDLQDGRTAKGETVAIRGPLTDENRFISLSSSTEDAHVGDYAVFHLKSSFPLDLFHFTVTSKGMVIHSDSVQSELASMKNIVTFVIPVSPEMAPVFTVVAYATAGSSVIADSVAVPVQTISRYKTTVSLRQHKDRTKKTVQSLVTIVPGSFVGLSVLRGLQLPVHGGNTISESKILNEMLRFESSKSSVHKYTLRTSDGAGPDKTSLLMAESQSPDSARTFLESNLVVFTDGNVEFEPNAVRCYKLGLQSCSFGGCYKITERCDGIEQCGDGSDEDYCVSDEDDQHRQFLIHRVNKVSDIFDPSDGDWAWYDIPVSDDGEEMNDLEVPNTDDIWHINAFAVHPEFGLSIVALPVEFDSTPPLLLALDAPSTARRGETISVKANIINFQDSEVSVLLKLGGSSDYGMVLVGPGGDVESYQPVLFHGDHQHFISVPPGSLMEVPLPIAPLLEKGGITVSITASTFVAYIEAKAEIEVVPEGVTIHKHISSLLDLRSRAHVFKFLDIPVEDSPIIPLFNYRRFVSGSPMAHVFISGDVFGPVFPSSELGSETRILERHLAGIESQVFSLGSNLWTLHYLRFSNQLTQERLRSGLEGLNLALSGLMEFYDAEGGFRLFKDSSVGIWPTAWALRLLGQCQFQDWENNFIIDRDLLSHNAEWIIKQQRHDGSYKESSKVVIDRRAFTPGDDVTADIALTAHVLIGLHEIGAAPSGELRQILSLSKKKSLTFIEKNLAALKDPYVIAMVCYVLFLFGSDSKEISFAMLFAAQIEEEGTLYWSRNKVHPYKVAYENQRPFLQPRSSNEANGLAVETTAYALLAYILRDGIVDTHERIVTWLNTMRMVDGGFVSSTDTLVAIQALAEYANRARIRDVTDLTVNLESSANPNSSWTLAIDSDSLSSFSKYEVENVWGHVTAIARGSGQAVLQMHLQYGVDWYELLDKPNGRMFDLTVNEEFVDFRNKSHVNIETCFRWVRVRDSQSSGAAVLEVDLPTGYGIDLGDAYQVVRKSEKLKDVRSNDLTISWYFDSVDSEISCFNYSVKRWYAVANHTKYRQAKIYEMFSPENFELVMLDATSLYVLDVCEVCGSYQCPYCPTYSGSYALVNSQYNCITIVVLFLLKTMFFLS